MDTFLAVAIGIINLFLMWYSVYVSVKRGKGKVASMFLLVGLLGLLLIGIVAYRSSAGTSAILAQLQTLHAAAPKHFVVSLSEDIKRRDKGVRNLFPVPH